MIGTYFMTSLEDDMGKLDGAIQQEAVDRLKHEFDDSDMRWECNYEFTIMYQDSSTEYHVVMGIIEVGQGKWRKKRCCQPISVRRNRGV